jgi:hypothetical protein
MRIKTTLAAALCVPLLTLAGASAAVAGEVSGPPRDGFATGEFNPIFTRHVANSICAFSGLNAYHPGKPAVFPTVQSYGMGVKAGMKAMMPSPGDACNGHDGWLVNPPPDEH